MHIDRVNKKNNKTIFIDKANHKFPYFASIFQALHDD